MTFTTAIPRMTSRAAKATLSLHGVPFTSITRNRETGLLSLELWEATHKAGVAISADELGAKIAAAGFTVVETVDGTVSNTDTPRRIYAGVTFKS